MSAYDRRLDRLESTLPLTDDLEAMLERVAAVVGIPPDGLRADAWQLAQRYADMSIAATIDALAAERDITPETLRADMAALIEEAAHA
ncbi:MAG: hypothetical protein M3434_11750 [Gemmatimonadota bacterium]|jgi:hypothetical protein|nr:hypothetical protein [Gemmatimonadota bacterium]